MHTRFLHVDDKRMHVFHSLFNDDAGILLATSEQMLLHVDTAAGRTVPAPRSMAGELTALKARDPGGPWPEGAGRRVGERH